MEELTANKNQINLKEGEILQNEKVAEGSQLSNNEKPKDNKGSVELLKLKETVKQKKIAEDKIPPKKGDSQVSKQNTELEKRDESFQVNGRRKESIKVLKRKRTEDGATIERVLSPGEVSPGYETVSSINSSLDFEDLDLSYSDSELDYNVIVQIENELALENFYRSSEREIYWEDRNDSTEKCYSRPKHFLGKYTNQRYNGYNSHGRSEYWRRNTDDRQRRSYGNEKWLREKEDYHYSRQEVSPGGGWSKCDGSSRVSRGSVCSGQNRRSRGSACGDLSRSLREGRMRDSRRSRSSERCFRSRDSRSPSYKVRKTEFRGSSSFYKSQSCSNRNLQFKRNYVSSSPSVWERLDNSPREWFKGNQSKPSQLSTTTHSKKRGGSIPFLVELGRRLKQAKNLRFPMKQESTADSAEYTESVNEAALMPQPVMSQTPNNQSSSQYTSLFDYSAMYSFQYPPVTSMSLENLPLVPGPAGLPVHVTCTGEQIPHDVDGRRIPVGPNGSYLPLDPNGRLFAHIVSPRNQAVPIHMTDDGVIRLPNSEPVPYGPSHNFPVNIDGSIIYLGPDSKPLGPCNNLPREPPLDILRMMQTEAIAFSSNNNLIKQESSATPHVSEFVELGSEVSSETKHSDTLDYSHQSAVNPSEALLDFAQNPCAKPDLLNNYQTVVQERLEKFSKRKETEKNVGVSPSKGGVKRSIPMKFIQRKTFKDSSDLEMNANSCDSDSSSDVTSLLKIQKDNDASKPLPSDSKSENFIIKKIQQALKSLTEENFKPPAVGRFILSTFMIDNVVETTPNQSPLSRTRTKLPFLLPDAATGGCSKDEPKAAEETAVSFRFLPEENSLEQREMTERGFKKTTHSTRLPALSFDFAVQCDFTSEIINNMNLKITELEMEVVRLRDDKTNPTDEFKEVHEMNEKNDEELKKALVEIEIKNNEILQLKQLFSEKEK